DGLGHEAAVRDDLGADMAGAEGIEHREERDAREGLAAPERHVLDVDGGEDAVDPRDEGRRGGRADPGPAVLRKGVVAIAAALVAEGRELDRDRVYLRARGLPS